MKKALTTFVAVIILAAVCLGLVAATSLGGNEHGTLSLSDFFYGSDDKPGGLLGALGLSASASDDGLERDSGDWTLKLVNADNPLPNGFEAATGLTSEGYLFDKRAVGALDAFLEAGRSEGMQLVLTSAYRTYDYQDMLYQNKVTDLIYEYGYSRSEAEEIAARSVARPGTSEHNLGLAADIVCEYYGILDDGYADTLEAQWLREHCAEYGFILRYDQGKEDITGIIYEPWHFRYVGVDAATYIMENGLALEEYVELL